MYACKALYMNLLKLLVPVQLLVMMAACKPKAEEAFVGTWHQYGGVDTLKIVKDNTTLRVTSSKHRPVKDLPAAYIEEYKSLQFGYEDVIEHIRYINDTTLEYGYHYHKIHD